MIGKGRIIEADLFDISGRLKQIDCDYFIFFDYRSRKFQLHNRSQSGNTLTLVLPFDRLDQRTLSFVRQTRSERKKQLLEEIEKHNMKLLRRTQNDLKNKIATEVLF